MRDAHTHLCLSPGNHSMGFGGLQRGMALVAGRHGYTCRHVPVRGGLGSAWFGGLEDWRRSLGRELQDLVALAHGCVGWQGRLSLRVDQPFCFLPCTPGRAYQLCIPRWGRQGLDQNKRLVWGKVESPHKPPAAEISTAMPSLPCQAGGKLIGLKEAQEERTT